MLSNCDGLGVTYLQLLEFVVVRQWPTNGSIVHKDAGDAEIWARIYNLLPAAWQHDAIGFAQLRSSWMHSGQNEK